MTHITATPEQRREWTRRSIEARVRNVAARKAAYEEAASGVTALKKEAKELEERISALQGEGVLHLAAQRLTNKTLLRESEIVAAAAKWHNCTGVYFLIKNGRIVYVGQSFSVFARVNQHKTDRKDFDSMAYVPCDAKDLDILESLYIHMFQPDLNGRVNDKNKSRPQAPLTLDVIFAMDRSRKRQDKRRSAPE